MPVPAGVEDGQTVRMAVGNNELFITFKVEKSNYFKRDGPDVHTDCTVSTSASQESNSKYGMRVSENHYNYLMKRFTVCMQLQSQYGV